MLTSLAFSMLLAALSPDAVASVDRSGPSRRARCRLDNAPIQRCRFTPLFGDGSFNIELSPERQLRLVRGGAEERAYLFVPIAPDKQIRMFDTFRRDHRDRACWVSEAKRIGPKNEGPPSRICVYR